MNDNLFFKSDEYQTLIDAKIGELKAGRAAERIWEKDYTLWSGDPTEITNRLDWLDSPHEISDQVEEIRQFVGEIKSAGFTHALLLGMGGSSLAPEVLRMTFGVKKDFLDLAILDSTDPGYIINCEKKLEGKKTLYIVSTKSGGTVETISLMKYFYTLAAGRYGRVNAGDYFIAITDPGSGLESMAEELNFRRIFRNNPNIGGRYSALSLFGMIPAALIGIDIREFLNRAREYSARTRSSEADNSALLLGTVMGTLASEGIDKLTFLFQKELEHVGSWIEQLIAESTGKDGKGILPVDLERPGETADYSNDRLFISFRVGAGGEIKEKSAELIKRDRPVVEIIIDDLYDLSAEFFRWEFATAVAGIIMGIQPFDQPNVESAKIQARRILEVYRSTGKLPDINWDLEENGMKLFGEIKGDSFAGVFKKFFALLDDQPDKKNYLAIHAYVTPDEGLFSALQGFREEILKRFKIPVTFGYGPRFLHSTGQLHKGDGGSGIFMQLLGATVDDAPIPDVPGETESSLTFGTLRNAQALGDREALIENGRSVITIELGDQPIGAVEILKDMAAV